MAWQRTVDPEAVKPWFLRGAPASEIVPELQPSADELVIDKLSMSAFEGTPLSYALKDCGILGVAIVGIALEIGIEPTVRHGTDLGFIPVCPCRRLRDWERSGWSPLTGYDALRRRGGHQRC